MKRIINCCLFVFGFLLLISCHQKPQIEVYFGEVTLKKVDNKKAIRVEIKNHTPVSLFVPTPITIEKIGINHPCLDRMLRTYSKISSHKEMDCAINKGKHLLDYIKTIPFSNLDHQKLKTTLLERGGNTFDMMFYYLRPGYHEFELSPEITFIQAESSTFIYYELSEPLTSIDRGEYKLDWLPKKILDRNISIKKDKMSLKDALNVNINGYQFYDGEVLVHPKVIKL